MEDPLDKGLNKKNRGPTASETEQNRQKPDP